MGTKKNKAVEPDYTFELKNGTTFDIYERERGKGKKSETYYSCKITLADSFVIYARVIEPSKKHGAFISYPSYKNSDGDYVNLAYCFDKDVISEISENLDDIFD